MADLPPIEMDFNGAGDPVVIVADQEAADPAALLKLVPALAGASEAAIYAQLVNHLVQGDDFELILDPQAFQAGFMQEYNDEDPEEEPDQGNSRLHDFGVPDFAEIHPPRFENGELVFFAVSSYLGYPYRASLPAGGTVEYEPVTVAD